MVFSPSSPEPLLSQTIPAKVSALVHCADTAEDCSRGLAIATDTCEMLYWSLGSSASMHQLAGRVGTQAATVSRVWVVIVQYNTVLRQYYCYLILSCLHY